MRMILLLAGIVLAIGVVLARLADRTAQVAAVPLPIAQGTARAQSSNSRTVTLTRGSSGHFWVDVRVDGRRMELVVDTGAWQVALRAGDAARLGTHATPRDYSVKVSTANGVARAAPVELRSVEIGNIIVRAIPALVHADEALGVNLLGMSFLSRARWTHERGKLMLEQ